MAEIETFAKVDDWAAACASRLAGDLKSALTGGGSALFAGPGGSTPAPVYERLARIDLDWSRVSVTLIDERYVPESSPDSNARLIRDVLLQGPAAKARFIPLYSPAVTVDRAAAQSAAALSSAGGRLDTVLPGLKPTVLGVPPGRDGAAPTIERLSMNLPWLIQAGRVILALKGGAKRAVYEREARGDPRTQPIAALLANAVPLEVLWTEAD
jgi:6-phosphogluconolactonase